MLMIAPGSTSRVFPDDIIYYFILALRCRTPPDAGRLAADNTRSAVIALNGLVRAADAAVRYPRRQCFAIKKERVREARHTAPDLAFMKCIAAISLLLAGFSLLCRLLAACILSAFSLMLH